VNDKDFVIDERSQRQVAIDLIDELQQTVRIVAILLMNFTRKAIAMIHNGVLVIATIQQHTAGKDEKARQQYQQHFQALFAAIDKVAVEHVAVGVRWQAILNG